MASDPRVLAGVGARGQNLVHLQKLGICVKDLNSTVAKRGSVSIGLMTSNGAIWFRYQRAILMR